MLLSIVPIGNSKGIRIPKAILEQCNIRDQIELEVENGRIILEPVHDSPRQGWDEAFSDDIQQCPRLRQNGDLLLDWELSADVARANAGGDRLCRRPAKSSA